MRRVAVTGMGIISPIGNTVAEFEDSLRRGICGVDRITRYDTAGAPVKVAAEVKGFQPELYMGYGDVRRTDLYAQYAMAAASQAMEDSGILGAVPPERLGVYFGSGIGGTGSCLKETEKLIQQGAHRVSPYSIPMMISNMAAGTIAIRFGAKGPTLPVVTACATSSNTVGEAYRAVTHGYADAILAGGSEATVCPLAIAGFTNSMALCESSDPDRASIPFDAERCGFVMGEGAGMLLLEEYEHALARDAKIYAELVGYGNTCDAYHITAPHPEAEGAARAFALALEQAGITPDDKVYINAHGTSTPMNDRAETIAIKTALGSAAENALVSSTKSMTGHMLGAAGAVEAIASVLALHTGVLPPTVGYRVADPECDLDYIPNQARRAEVGFALSSSLGFGGHNAVLAFKKL